MLRDFYLVVGLGATGLSCVRYLLSKNLSVIAVDSREHPPTLTECQKTFPNLEIHLGKFSEDLFLRAQKIIVSPGVSLKEPCIQKAIQKNIPVIGDVELFARDAKAPIIAITGSNGKSTLTTLMGELINHAGKTAIVCGNIGLPVLDAITQPVPDFYVVELSSFQLDTTYSLRAHVAVVINVSPDHMDRYATIDDYRRSKQKVYLHCEHAVVNADEPEIWKELTFLRAPVAFTLKPLTEVVSDSVMNVFRGKFVRQDAEQKPTGMYSRRLSEEYIHHGIRRADEELWGLCDGYLAHGEKKLIAISELTLQQRHNNQNFLAALAIGAILKLPIDSMLTTLKQFSGLAHRCQLVKKIHGVAWFNDSKATNVGAAIAAIESMGHRLSGKLILLAGGDSKGVSLIPLKNPVKKYVSHVILFGKDADLLQAALENCTAITRVNHLREAVNKAKQMTTAGDVVLLAPACASLDQYENYAARGKDFVDAVNGIT